MNDFFENFGVRVLSWAPNANNIFSISSDISIFASVKLGNLADGSLVVAIPKNNEENSQFRINNFNINYEYVAQELQRSHAGSGGGSSNLNLTEYNISNFNICTKKSLIKTINQYFIVRERSKDYGLGILPDRLSNGVNLFFRNNVAKTQLVKDVLNKAVANGALGSDTSISIFAISNGEISTRADEFTNITDGMVYNGCRIS